MSVFCYLAKTQPESNYGSYSFRILIKEWASSNTNLSVKWFIEYVKNVDEERDKQIELAFNLADKYFQKKKYEISAGWYLAGVNLSKEDFSGINEKSLLAALKTLFFHRVPFNVALQEAILVGKKARNQDVNKAIKRLQMISAVGIQCVDFLEEETYK